MRVSTSQFGFSILQVLLVISILLVITSMALPSLYQFQLGAQIDTVAAEVGQNLRRAQTRAMIGYDNSNWGLYFDDHTYTIFSGDSYVLRNESRDEEYYIADAIQIVNDFDNEILFTKISGIPNNSGQISLTNIAAEESLITINIAGVVEYR
jgi:type II secretory pathway pseudopilin PulG